MSDPAELQPAGRFEWERIVRRCLIPKDLKLVAYTLAQFASSGGAHIRPGVPVLAATCRMSTRVAERHLAALRDLGLIMKTANGGGRSKQAAAYRLTIPSDLLERVELLPPSEVTPAIDSGGSSESDTEELPPPIDGGSSDPDQTELPPLSEELPPNQPLTPANDPPLTSDVQKDHPLRPAKQDHPIRDLSGDVTSERTSSDDRLMNVKVAGIDLRAALRNRRPA